MVQLSERLMLFRWKFARFLFSQKLQNDFTLGFGGLGIRKPLPEQGQVFEMDIPVHVVPSMAGLGIGFCHQKPNNDSEHSKARLVLREVA